MQNPLTNMIEYNLKDSPKMTASFTVLKRNMLKVVISNYYAKAIDLKNRFF